MHPCLRTPKGRKRTVCPFDSLLPRLGDKWTVHVMALLAEAEENRLRFSELKKSIEGISQKMLTATLKTLERDGLIVRRVFPEVPPRVEYRLTDIGNGMIPALDDFMDWMQKSWPAIQTHREEFDRRKKFVNGYSAPVENVIPKETQSPACRHVSGGRRRKVRVS
jgi:DNA-binding HxlR family transcriptional regulator